MGILKWVVSALLPIVLEHGPPIFRDWLKTRAGQAKPGTNHFQQLVEAVEELRQHSVRMDSNLEALNTAFTANENKLRKWVLTLLIWNVIITLALVVLAWFATRH